MTLILPSISLPPNPAGPGWKLDARRTSQGKAWQRRGAIPASEVHESFRRCGAGFAAAKVLHHLVVTAVDFLAVLASVDKQSCLFLFSHRGDVNVMLQRDENLLRRDIAK
jgi:hypothetical protein